VSFWDVGSYEMGLFRNQFSKCNPILLYTSAKFSVKKILNIFSYQEFFFLSVEIIGYLSKVFFFIRMK